MEGGGKWRDICVVKLGQDLAQEEEATRARVDRVDFCRGVYLSHVAFGKTER